MLLGMDGRWAIAEEPLHWLVDSPDPVHSGDAKSRAGTLGEDAQDSTQRSGPRLAFRRDDGRVDRSAGGPGGLRPRRDQHGTVEPVQERAGGQEPVWLDAAAGQAAGGKVKGVLWYQGESDSLGQAAWKAYPRVFSDFISAVRSDLGQPELPFYYVQIGRFIAGVDPKGWNAVQDAQRTLPERVPNTAVVSVIDLELDDGFTWARKGSSGPGSAWPGSPCASSTASSARPLPRSTG